MADVQKYVVLVDRSIAQKGRFLNKGEVIELEDKHAHGEFANRVALESDPNTPTDRWEESQGAIDAFEIEIRKVGLRAHERVQLLEARKVLLEKQLDSVNTRLATAQADLKSETEKIQQRHAAIVKPAVEAEAPRPIEAEKSK